MQQAMAPQAAAPAPTIVEVPVVEESKYIIKSQSLELFTENHLQTNQCLLK
jgi:hypothetical protein